MKELYQISRRKCEISQTRISCHLLGLFSALFTHHAAKGYTLFRGTPDFSVCCIFYQILDSFGGGRRKRRLTFCRNMHLCSTTNSSTTLQPQPNKTRARQICTPHSARFAARLRLGGYAPVSTHRPETAASRPHTDSSRVEHVDRLGMKFGDSGLAISFASRVVQEATRRPRQLK